MVDFRSIWLERFDPPLWHAAVTAGLIPPEDWPLLAQQALERGHDGKVIRSIAGLSRPTKSDLPSLENFFSELGSCPVSVHESGLHTARVIARGICAGRIEPYEGANYIWRRIFYAAGEPEELLSFVGLASEYEDRLDYRTDIASQIKEVAAELASGEVHA
jgi:hypothetical protein